MSYWSWCLFVFFFFQAEDGIRDHCVTGVQTCALPIWTGFGGNVDFMTPANSWLVDYEETLVGPEGENYPAHGIWAEPDVDHAAELMRRVWEEREEASARAERGRMDVAQHF